MLMTIDGVMTELKLGRTMVYRMIKSNEIPSILIGGARRFPRQQVKEWVDSLTYPVIAHA